MSAPLRALFINPCATYAHEIAQKCYPPLNLLYLARALLDEEFDAHVLDANALALDNREVAAHAAGIRPDLIGLPLYTEIMGAVHRTATALQEAVPGARFVMGGAHASALPRETLRGFSAVEFILRGQAEKGIVKLCRALQDGGPLDGIPGLTWRAGDGSIGENPPERPERDLDSIGAPARELVADMYEQKRYYTILVRERPVDTLITSRGCPFACNFCYNQDHYYRCHSPDRVIDEIVSIYERGIRDIEICDDTFTFDRDRAMRIFDRLIRERLPVSFRIKSRVDVVDDAFVRRAKRAGVYMISYGMESGDDEMLRRMNKRTSVADNARACEITRRHGIAAHSGWILGYPGETPESIERTVNFIVKIKPTTAQVAQLRPYPQTVAYQEAKDAGMLRGEWGVAEDEYPWVQLPWVRDREHMRSIVQKAVRKIYYRPHYVKEFGLMVIGNANVTLARYAFQELRKSVRSVLGVGRERIGSV